MKLPTWWMDQLAGKRRPRRSNNAAAVVSKLESGAVLYSGRVGDGRWWMLSDGTTLTGNTAKAVIANPRVIWRRAVPGRAEASLSHHRRQLVITSA
jgi:hypothetical protein